MGLIKEVTDKTGKYYMKTKFNYRFSIIVTFTRKVTASFKQKQMHVVVPRINWCVYESGEKNCKK